MQVHRRHRTAVAIIVGALSLVLITGVANAREVQLAGMRLGQHAINLLDVYGQPMGIATGQGEEFASGAAAGAGMGMEGAAPGAAGAAGAGGVQRNPYPLWALPVWVTLEANEVQWLYQVGPVVLGFVLDRDGYIKSIAVAAENCNFARTALWQPHQYVKLGDNYKRVIYRYGWPD